MTLSGANTLGQSTKLLFLVFQLPSHDTYQLNHHVDFHKNQKQTVVT